MKLGADAMLGEIPIISTRISLLRSCPGVGGLPKRRVVEIFGPEASGKTTLALHVVQKHRRRAALLPSSMPNMR